MQTMATSDLWRAFNPLRLAGPIFDKELRVASRRRRTYLLRFVYIVVLSWFVFSVWGVTVRVHAWNPSAVVQASQMGSAAGAIVTGIIWIQFLMSQLLALVLLSGVIGDEIRKRSLDALLVSPISSVEIVLGKLFGQLLQLVPLLLVSLPLLAVIRVFGGVPWGYVVSGLCITLTAALVVGSLSLFLSVADRNAQNVVAGAILWCLVVWGLAPWAYAGLRSLGYIGPLIGQKVLYLSNPYHVLLAQSISGTAPGPIAHQWPLHCLIMLALAAVLVAASVRRVRRVALLPVHGGGEARSKVADGSTPSDRLSRRGIRRIQGAPITWRERKRPILPRGRRGLVQTIAGFLVLIAMVAAVFLLIASAQGDPRPLCILSAVLLSVIFVFNVASGAAASLTREKEGRSLHVLLTIPCDDGQIIRHKAMGILLRNLPLLLPVPLLGAMACLGGNSHLDADNAVGIAVWFSLTLVGHTALLMGLGLCLSAYFKTTTAATALTFVLFLGVKIVGAAFFLPMLGLHRGSAGFLVSALVQTLIYVGVGWVLACAAAAGLRPNCQK